MEIGPLQVIESAFDHRELAVQLAWELQAARNRGLNRWRGGAGEWVYSPQR